MAPVERDEVAGVRVAGDRYVVGEVSVSEVLHLQPCWPLQEFERSGVAGGRRRSRPGRDGLSAVARVRMRLRGLEVPLRVVLDMLAGGELRMLPPAGGATRRCKTAASP